MNKDQIEWAKQHDWYSHSNGGVVYVIEHVTLGGGWSIGTKAFNNFQELRAWAGY